MLLQIALLGPAKTGKSSFKAALTGYIKSRYSQSLFPIKLKEDTSLQLSSYEEARLLLDESENCYLQIWEVFNEETARSYASDAKVVFLFFTLDDFNSFEDLKKRVGEYQSWFRTKENAPTFFLVGTKADLEAEVYEADIQAFAREQNIKQYIPFSSKTVNAIQAVLSILKQLATKIFQDKKRTLNPGFFGGKPGDRELSPRLRKANEECGWLWKNSQTQEENVRDILDDYALENKTSSLLYNIHYFRNHTKVIASIVKEINQKISEGETDFLEPILSRIESIPNKNYIGSLSLRMSYINYRMGREDKENDFQEELSRCCCC